MNVDTRILLWVRLDEMIRWAEKQGLHLVEDELISDAHSHPRRIGYDTAAAAVQQAFEIIRWEWAETQGDVVLDGDAVFSVGPDRPALLRHDDSGESPASG